MLDHSAIEHRCAHSAPFALGLGAAQDPEDDALFAGQAVTRVGEFVVHDATLAQLDGSPRPRLSARGAPAVGEEDGGARADEAVRVGETAGTAVAGRSRTCRE
jgi:hypothetical protein